MLSQAAPSISVVVPAYNAAATIDECLVALNRQTLPRPSYEIIVVDDGSTDATVTRAEKHAEVMVLCVPHRGPAAARNTGVRAACAQVVLFTDADCVPTENWVEEMSAPFADARVMGTKGVYRTLQHELIARFVQLEYEEKYHRMSSFKSIDFIDTCSAAYRRDLFLSNGGFDETFPVACVEDQEFSFRLARQGRQLVFAPQAAVYHRHAASLASYARRKFRIGYYKVRVHRRHPAQALQDSHTPPTLKLQVGLLPLTAAAAIFAGFVPTAQPLVAILAASLILTMLPLMLFVAHRDRVVALFAPGMIVLRAGALALGLCAGLVGEVVHHRDAGQPASALGQT